MVDESEKKEDKFDFDSAGEEPGYISLEQARVEAMRDATQNPGNYGETFAGVRMVFDVAEQEEGEDYYIITMAFRPEGDFEGTPGREQFFIEKEGQIAYRQVRGLPKAKGGRGIPVLPIVIGVVVLAIGAGAAVVFASSGGDEPADQGLGMAPSTPTIASSPEPSPTVAAVVPEEPTPAPERPPSSLAAAAGEVVPTPTEAVAAEPAAMPVPMPVANSAVISDSQAPSDTVTFILTDVPALPPNTAYEGWLATDDGSVTLSVGVMEVDAAGAINHTYVSGENLIDYSKAFVTQEPVPDPDPDPSGVLVSEYGIPSEGLGVIRPALAGITKVQEQLQVAILHANLSKNSSSLNDVRQHAHHVINIIEGEGGPNFDASFGNPDDGVGVLNYAREATGFTAVAGDSPEVRLINAHGALVKVTVENAFEWAGQARDQALGLVDLDDIATAKLLLGPGEETVIGLLNNALAGTDADYDGTVEAIAGEGGAKQAYAQAQLMATYSFQPAATAPMALAPTVSPTPTPLSPAPARPAPTAVPNRAPAPSPTGEPSPTASPSDEAEQLVRRAMVVLNDLTSFRLEGGFETQGAVVTMEGLSSGKSVTLRMVVEDPASGTSTDLFEGVLLPPFVYLLDESDGTWYRTDVESIDVSDFLSVHIALFVFPDPDVPLMFYNLTLVGTDTVDGVETTILDIEADWQGIVEWLEAEGKLASVAARLSGESPVEFKESYTDDPPQLVEVWIDGDGFMRQVDFHGEEDGEPVLATFRFSEFNEPIVVQAPAEFEVVLEMPPPETAPLTAATAPTLTVSTTVAEPGQAITASFSGAPGQPGQWIALIAIGDPNENYGEWDYISGSEGSYVFTAPSTPGVYDVRLMLDSGYTDIARSRPIEVGEAAPAPQPTPPVTGAAQGRIAFTSDRDGNFEIYVMNGDGSGKIRLTNNPASDEQPSWSPDGTRIAFATDRDGNFNIFVMNADGSGDTGLTDVGRLDNSPSWSPDGEKIAFASNRDGQFEIYVMDADGSNQANITEHLADDFDPSWSPDGEKIAFTSSRDGHSDIYLIDVRTLRTTRLTQSPTSDLWPSWSPDGTRIAFTSDRDSGQFEIYVMTADGSNHINLTNNEAFDYKPSWSPDGSKIAFASNRDGTFQIYLMSADGGNQTRLTNADGDDFWPSWSP